MSTSCSNLPVHLSRLYFGSFVLVEPLKDLKATSVAGPFHPRFNNGWWSNPKKHQPFACLPEAGAAPLKSAGLDTLLYSLVATWKQSVDLPRAQRWGSPKI